MAEGGGKFIGIGIMVAIILVLNLLSYVFNWGWVFY